MKKVYEILPDRDTETNLMYREWVVPSEFPIANNFVEKPIPLGIPMAKYDFRIESWVEDTFLSEKNKVDNLDKTIQDAEDRIHSLEDVILELVIMNAMTGGDI